MHDPACLNHADLNELLAHAHLLDPVRQDRLQAVDFRIHKWPERFDRNGQHYLEQAGIVAMSSHNAAHRFSNCGFGGSSCNVWKLCAYCAWRRKMELQKKFLRLFKPGECFSCTIAYDGFVSCNPHRPDPLYAYWMAGVYALRQMVEEGYFLGAVWSEDLHIDAFTTGAVHPHVHAVIVAEEVTPQRIDQLQAHVVDFKPEYGESVEQRVSTCTREIRTQFHWANALSYLCKPVKLWRPYQTDYEMIVPSGRGAVAFLNQCADEVLEGFALHARHRRQLDYKGVLDARSRTRFIGVPKAQRNRRIHYAATAEMLKELNFEHAVNPEVDYADQMPIEGVLQPAFDLAVA